jgi:hypothetical protein
LLILYSPLGFLTLPYENFLTSSCPIFLHQIILASIESLKSSIWIKKPIILRYPWIMRVFFKRLKEDLGLSCRTWANAKYVVSFSNPIAWIIQFNMSILNQLLNRALVNACEEGCLLVESLLFCKIMSTLELGPFVFKCGYDGVNKSKKDTGKSATPNAYGHSSNGRLLVIMREPCSYHSQKISKSK